MTSTQPDPDERSQASDPATTPDNDTQSSAASAQGNRTDEENGGSRAPNDPAEGAADAA